MQMRLLVLLKSDDQRTLVLSTTVLSVVHAVSSLLISGIYHLISTVLGQFISIVQYREIRQLNKWG